MHFAPAKGTLVPGSQSSHLDASLCSKKAGLSVGLDAPLLPGPSLCASIPILTFKKMCTGPTRGGSSCCISGRAPIRGRSASPILRRRGNCERLRVRAPAKKRHQDAALALWRRPQAAVKLPASEQTYDALLGRANSESEEMAAFTLWQAGSRDGQGLAVGLPPSLLHSA
jgi:hypothetical protein